MDNQLAHHGILGMKWGVRRYQNKDGSLTSSGKNRYKMSIIISADSTLKSISDYKVARIFSGDFFIC